MTEEEIRRKAEKKVNAKKGFYAHLMAYLIIIGFLFFINLFTSPAYWWFVFPALGWGIGLAFHYFGVFGFARLGDEDWEEREIAKEILRLRRNQQMLEEGDDMLDLDEEFLDLKEIKRQKKEWDDGDFV